MPALAVPEELDFHATVFVSPNLFSGLTHDYRSLRPMDGRFAGETGRAVLHNVWNGLEPVGVFERILITRAIAGVAPMMFERDQRVFGIGTVAEVVRQGESVA